MQTIYLAREGCSNLCVICDDTDVILPLLHHYALNNLDNNFTLAPTSPQRAVVDIKESVKKNKKIISQVLVHMLSVDVTQLQCHMELKGYSYQSIAIW